MRVVKVNEGNRRKFLDYCERWGTDHDESFIPDAERVPDPDYPACLLMDGDEVAGAACLVRTPPFVASRKGRFMIFHTATPSSEGYRLLLEAVGPHFAGLGRVFLFVPEAYRQVRDIWEGLGFAVERWAFLLAYRAPHFTPPELPPGFRFRPVLPGDEAGMADAVALDNHAFDGHPGHVEYEVEKLAEDLAADTAIEGGLMVLYDGERPVGTVWVTKDEESASEVSMVTVHRDYRGRGLGRAVLRQGIAFSRASGLETVYLAVNAENEAAVRLYLSEGFAREKVVVCYQLFV